MGISVEHRPPPVGRLNVPHHSLLDVAGLESLDLIRRLWDRSALSVTCCFRCLAREQSCLVASPGWHLVFRVSLVLLLACPPHLTRVGPLAVV
eukprot:g13340.t1